MPTSKVGFAKYIDQTCLLQTATASDIDRLCEGALSHGSWSIRVSPWYVKHAAKRLKGSGVKVCSVVGFPLGFTPARVKLAEAEEEVGAGADRIGTSSGVRIMADWKGQTAQMEKA